MSKTTLTEALGPEDLSKLRKTVDAGLVVLQEIDDLKEGLKDTVKNLAEELNIKPALINKALRVARKQSLEAERESLDTIEDILNITGHD